MRRSGRNGAALLLGVATLGVVLIAVASALHRHALAFTLGVDAARQVVSLERGVPACQTPVDVLVPFEAIQFKAGTSDPVSPPLEVTVRAGDAGRPLAAARVPQGYDESRPVVTRVGRVEAGGPVSVCIEASGDASADLYGDLGRTLPGSGLRVGTAARDADLSLMFLRDRPVSAVSLVPAMLERATLFDPGWLGPPAFVILGLLVVLAVPGLLAVSLARAAGPDRRP